MIKITKTELKEKIVYLVHTLGLTNAEIAERLNSDYNAEDKEKLTAINIADLKKQLGIKGIKPKKKSLFEFVDETPVREGWEEAFKADSQNNEYSDLESIKQGLLDIENGDVIRLDPTKSVFEQI